MKEDTFAESFEKHTLLWVGVFTFIFTTILGVIGQIFMYLKILKTNNSKSLNENEKETENKLIINSDVDQSE